MSYSIECCLNVFYNMISLNTVEALWHVGQIPFSPLNSPIIPFLEIFELPSKCPPWLKLQYQVHSCDISRKT
jgi:hypothetical protein